MHSTPHQPSERRARDSHQVGPAISLVDVTVRFSSAADGSGAPPVPVLSSVDLDVQAGEFVALVGASGCGKTTILNLIAGLLNPTGGDVLVQGESVARSTPDTGYMFARDALLPWRTAQRNVELGLEGRPGWDRARRRVRAQEMLSQMGLRGNERRYRAQLSQGMRQRVALARTFAPSPGILLMDEPFAALDALTKFTIQQQFLEVWERQPQNERQTVVFVTHDLQEAVLLADRVVVLASHPGRVHYAHSVDLPRPRAQVMEEIIFTNKFRAVHSLLFGELQTARAQQNQNAGGVKA